MISVLLSLLVHKTTLYGQELPSEKPICISLGSKCNPAICLRLLGLREQAFPFDWLGTSFNALYNALNDDFKYFLQDIKVNPIKTGIIDFYGINFVHDLPTMHHPVISPDFNNPIASATLHPDWKLALPDVREKYQRRIARFNELCNSTATIYFIRTDEITQAQSLELHRLLTKKYPLLTFTLVVLKQDQRFKKNWKLPGIKNFYLHGSDDIAGFTDAIKSLNPAFASITVPTVGRHNDARFNCSTNHT